MVKVENIHVYNLARAIYSARNPLESWDQSDSDIENDVVGKNDLRLANKLFHSGDPSHRKYLRQTFVSMDVTAPLYWWKEADQYKVGTTTNSCSTMHTITKKPITLADFSIDNYEMAGNYKDAFCNVVDDCENLRKAYLASMDKRYWRWLIQLLPESFNQMRTLTMNYENVVNMIHQRSNHKLQEWRDFTDVLRELPYVKEIMDVQPL